MRDDKWSFDSESGCRSHFWTRRSDSASSAEVASSSTRTGVGEHELRAMATLALAAGKKDAPFADNGIVATGSS